MHVEAEEEEIELFFDQDKMEKILTNLLSNAFKFTPRGGNSDCSRGIAIARYSRCGACHCGWRRSPLEAICSTGPLASRFGGNHRRRHRHRRTGGRDSAHIRPLLSG